MWLPWGDTGFLFFWNLFVTFFSSNRDPRELWELQGEGGLQKNPEQMWGELE